jgi:hypothetical protein
MLQPVLFCWKACIVGVTGLTGVSEAAGLAGRLAARDINVIAGVVEYGSVNGHQARFGQLCEGGVNDLGGEGLVDAVSTGRGCQRQVKATIRRRYAGIR